MKAVSAVVATILILLITVALAASAYVWFSGTVSSTTQTGSKQINQTTQTFGTSFKIDSIKGDTIYVRNSGTVDITNLTVFVDGKMMNVTSPVIKPGETGKVTVNSFIDYNSAKSLKVVSGVASTVITPTSGQNYDSLVGYWKFDEATGIISFADSSGNKNDGSCYSSQYCPTNGATGKINTAATFDGVDDYLQVSDSNSLRLTNKASIEVWLNKNAQTNGGIVSKTSGSGFELLDKNGPIQLIWLWSGITSNGVVPTGSWNHIAVTYDGTQFKIYINGQLDKTQAYTGSASTTGVKLYIGIAQSGMRYNGTMDELKIWNRTLSDNEIAAHYLDAK